VDLTYSITLIVALIAGVLALLQGFNALRRRDARKSAERSHWARLLGGRAVFGVLVLGTLSLLSSVVVHLLWGHGPTTPAPMDFEGLVLEHEAFPVAAVILVSGFMLNAYAARRPRNRGDA
jgi:uncharacterized membrane protein